MPLPKAPTKPADRIDPAQVVMAKPGKVPRATHPVQAYQSATPQAQPRVGVPAPLAAPAIARQAPYPAPSVAAAQPVPAAEQVFTRPGPASTGLAVAPTQLRAPAAPGPRAGVVAPPQVAQVAQAPVSGSRRRHARKDSTVQRLFVLDTNVLMHDPSCLSRFAEHDIFIPIVTLEELDNHKRGATEVARNVRQVTRSIDSLIEQADSDLTKGLLLSKLGDPSATGRMFLQNQALSFNLPDTLPMGKADNQIIGVVAALKQLEPQREVVLVSKDINMRIKASMLGLAAEDYFNDQVIEDSDLLETGVVALPQDFWETHDKDMESWQKDGFTYYRLNGPMPARLSLNQFVHFDGTLKLVAQVIERTDRHMVLRTVRDYTHAKNTVWGLTARNQEQNFALNLLCDPDIDFVTLLGQAGTGKTLLALAAGLAQVLEQKRFTEIIMTRATVPVGDDIGYLPGTEEEKMQPWMGALEDNLEVLNQSDPNAGEWGRSTAADLIGNRIRVKALSFMRGRTFINKFLIIDEAQNLTPKQMKTLITRAGPGTKVVCLGNIAQIDTPYLSEASSGLSFAVERMRGWAHAGHITLQRGERSRLADFAAEVL